MTNLKCHRPPFRKNGVLEGPLPFNPTDLRLFLHVAQTANITAGAMRANMALASASERIRGMEEAAGVALLERRHRGVALTPAGRAVVHHAQLMLQQFGRLT